MFMSLIILCFDSIPFVVSLGGNGAISNLLCLAKCSSSVVLYDYSENIFEKLSRMVKTTANLATQLQS